MVCQVEFHGIASAKLKAQCAGSAASGAQLEPVGKVLVWRIPGLRQEQQKQ